MLEVKGVSKDYGNGEKALDNVSFSVARSEVVGIIGKSGAGKSTLLQCINRMCEHTGEIIINGECIEKANSKALRKIRSSVGMIFQNYNLVESLSVFENVLHGCLGKMGFWRGMLGWYTKEECKKAYELIDAVGLSSMPYRACVNLSGGQKQRVGIARALMAEPVLILADEPTSSLDVASSNLILELLKKICKEKGIAAIISLHQIELAKKFSDRIIALKDGKIIFDCLPQSLNDEKQALIFN